MQSEATDNNEKIACPECAELWTLDEVAECVDGILAVDGLYAKLWRLHGEAKNRTPLGGDGSDGTVETPGERLDSKFGDKLHHWWDSFEPHEQRAILAGFGKMGML